MKYALMTPAALTVRPALARWLMARTQTKAAFADAFTDTPPFEDG
jgi:hypothetical protein